MQTAIQRCFKHDMHQASFIQSDRIRIDAYWLKSSLGALKSASSDASSTSKNEGLTRTIPEWVQLELSGSDSTCQ